MKRRIPILAASLLAVSLLAPAATAAQQHTRSSDADTVLKADVMAPVTEPFTGATNAIRGVPGGGVPWEIDEAKAVLRSDGQVEIKVEGLVLARRAPVPEELQGTNPVPSFMGIVSCLTAADGVATTVNVSTDPVPATTTGNAKIDDTVALPSPCFAPIVFVTSPTGAWFAVSGH